METKKLKCRKCGYEWESKSEMVWVTCPSCMYKSPHPLGDKEEEKVQ